MVSTRSQKIAIVSILVFQAILIVLFSFFVNYGAGADPHALTSRVNATEQETDSKYPMFQDIHVMIFVGFGFLMTFLRRYAYSALGLTFLISAMVIQWGMLCHGFFRMHSTDDKIQLDIVSLINADIIAAVILISFGAVLGRTSPIQLFVMAVLETAIFVANEFINADIFQAMDAGGSMYVHAFGAYFGLAVSFVLARGVSAEEEENKLESSTYQSDISSMIGTLFLWMFWPSFNAALLTGDEKQRAIINTYLSLTTSCITAFAVSSLVNKNTKFDMVHVQNATLAGGVCVGTSSNMMVQPYGALLIGSFAGVWSTIGYKFIQGFLSKKIRIHDTCGVNNLHGMPGVAAGLIGAIMAAMANKNTYGTRLYNVFPAMGPEMKRTAMSQAGFQLVGLGITLFVSVVGGLVTGCLIRYVFPNITPEEYYDDAQWWYIPDEEEIE